MNSDTNLTPENPRLTAFALGQLEGAERDAVAALVAASPALQAEVAAIQADAQWLRTQLQEAAASPSLSASLEAQVLGRLEQEAAQAEEKNLEKSPVSAHPADAFPRAARADALRANATVADWRRDLGRSARRPIVWWSPFVLPLAACFVAAATVGLLWWNGSYFPTPRDTAIAAARGSAPLDAPVASAAHTQGAFDNGRYEPHHVHGVSAARTQGALPAPVPTGRARPVATAALKQDALAFGGVAPVSVANGAASFTPLSPQAGSLFAPRAWAYRRDGRAVRESAMSVPDAPEYFLAEEMLLADSGKQQEQAADFVPVASTDTGTAIASADSLPVAAVAVAAAVDPATALEPERVPLVTMSSRSTPVAAESSSVAGSFKSASAERSSQVLAEAAALVRPVAADIAGGFGTGSETDVATVGSPSPSPAPVTVTAASAQTASAAVAAQAAVGTGATTESVAGTGAAVESVADIDGDNGGAPLGEAANPSASQIAALAAAQHFRRASLEELEAAAFATEGKSWRAHKAEAATEQIVETTPQPEAVAVPQPATVPLAQKPNLASRYVQLQLWVEAGQLPPPAAVDVDAIVRDAVPVYAAGTLRQMRAQAARALASGTAAEPVGASAAALAGKRTGAAVIPGIAVVKEGQPTPAELELLEARSLMLRLVRGYATILKDRPADAGRQLDALTEQLKQRPRVMRGRHGQEFLKLLETTRPLL